MQFVFTAEVSGHRPGVRIAEIMRQAAEVVERQVPLKHHHMVDVYGVQKCEWDIEEEVARK
jgi:hypothetical protein